MSRAKLKNEIRKHLIRLGLIEQTSRLILLITEGRISSIYMLNNDECHELLNTLERFQPTERIKSMIIDLCYSIGLMHGYELTRKLKNLENANAFLKEKGEVKKDLKEMNYLELITTHRQLTDISTNEQNNIIYQSEIAVINLLEDLNINTIK